MDCKKRTGEINTSPVPAALKDQMLRSGLWICSYYEAVRCSCLFSRKNLETHAFPFFVITQMLNHKGFYCTSSSQIQKTPQGALMVAVPGKMIKYGSFEEYFTEDSIAFMGNTAEIMMRNGVISHGLYDLGTERRLLPIINKLREATMPPKEMTAISAVPPPISTIMLPVGSLMGRPAPMAAAMGSSITDT